MPRLGSRLRAIALAGIGLMLLPAKADAKRKRPGGKRGTIAIFPLAPNPSVPEDIRREFDGLMHSQAQAAGLTVLAGVALDHRLRESAAGAIGICRTNAACIAKLGKKIYADEVVFASASTAGDSVTIAVFVVVPSRARIDRKASLQVAIKEEVEEALAQIFPAIFKVQAPGGSAPTDPLAAMGELDLEPLTAIAPFPPSPEPIPPPVDEPDLDIDPSPPANPTELVDPLEGELDDDFGPEPGGVAMTPQPIVAPPTPWLMVGAYSLGGLGVVTAGVGGGFGVQSLVLHKRATPLSVPQRLAAERQSRSEAAAERANLMYLLSGTLAVFAGVMFVVDLVLFDNRRGPQPPSGTAILVW